MLKELIRIRILEQQLEELLIEPKIQDLQLMVLKLCLMLMKHLIIFMEVWKGSVTDTGPAEKLEMALNLL